MHHFFPHNICTLILHGQIHAVCHLKFLQKTFSTLRVVQMICFYPIIHAFVIHQMAVVTDSTRAGRKVATAWLPLHKSISSQHLVPTELLPVHFSPEHVLVTPAAITSMPATVPSIFCNQTNQTTIYTTEAVNTMVSEAHHNILQKPGTTRGTSQCWQAFEQLGKSQGQILHLIQLRKIYHD